MRFIKSRSKTKSRTRNSNSITGIPRSALHQIRARIKQIADYAETTPCSRLYSCEYISTKRTCYDHKLASTCREQIG